MGKKIHVFPDPNSPRGDLLAFECPGCRENHAFDNRWAYNGDSERPTFSPSLLLKGTKITEKGWKEIEEWKAAGCPPRSEKIDTIPTVCHSFVTDGRIQFLSDCTHALAGKTVDIPDWED